MSPIERRELANRLYREFHTRCFWHCPRDLDITDDLIPFVVKGLRMNGGHRGFQLADMLRIPVAARGIRPGASGMPLTAFQKGVARVLAANRSPESHIAGGAVINRAETGLRISDDLDIFHDAADSVAACAELDGNSLRQAGYTVEWTIQKPGMVKAEISRGGERVRIDWSNDSAFRFFPVLPDPEFGYCLHPADLATNKVLALAGRSEVRDFLDILQIDQNYLSLGAVVWAACGKDAGFTPPMLLHQANRHSRYQLDDFRVERLTRAIDLQQMKAQWLAAHDRAERLFERLPSEELGCLYLDAVNNPVTPEPDDPGFANLKRHRGSVRGSWPSMA